MFSRAKSRFISKELIFVPNVLRFSTSFQVMSNWNKPRSSGDKGPENNYRKKMLKKANKEGGESTFNTAHTLIEILKAREGDDQLSKQNDDVAQDSMRNILSEIKTKLNDSKRSLRNNRMEQSKRFGYSDDIGEVYRTKQTMRPISFMKSDSRLGIFHPSPHVKVMPMRSITLMENDKQKKLNDICVLQTTSYFDDMMEESGVPFSRNFPIDNEDYEHGEAKVSFKDHVLLDHLLKDFPRRGPVRHFMELVVTGLSMNPGYTVKEKQDFINWYKEYFSQFSPEELQMLAPTVIPKLKPDSITTTAMV